MIEKKTDDLKKILRHLFLGKLIKGKIKCLS